MLRRKKEKIDINKAELSSKRRVIKFEDETIKDVISQLNGRNDIKAERIKRLLALPDLTEKENSPIKFLTDEIIDLPRFKDFDLITFPKIVSAKNNFDLLNTPEDHPSRRETDTYYVDNNHILRTHTTTMWPFYLKNPKIIKKIKENGYVGALSTGIVFRKDEIDRNHFPAFHQVDGLYICERKQKVITLDDLSNVLIDIAKSIFGENVEWKFIKDTFPFTDPSLEMNIKWKGNWMEILGAGLVHKQVLKNFGLDPSIYNGWAFGFGIDRLAMVKMEIPDIRILWSEDERITRQFKNINSRYKEVSKYPATTRDVSFIIEKSVNLNNYYEIIRDCAGNLIEEVKLLDSYENKEKFGEDKKSYTFRIVYRAPERTLTNEEINKIQNEIREKTKKELNAALR